jgi:hypothetical protein
MCSINAWGHDILIFATSFQKSNIGWPQQPQTEKMLKSNLILHDSTKYFFSKNIEIKLSSRTWMGLKSSVVIFQALEPLQPQWPQQPQQPRWPQWPQQPQQPRWPQWPQQPHFTKELHEHDSWIIPGARMTSTDPFLWDESSKIQFFTGIWYLFCWTLLRPAYVTSLKTGCKYQNVITSGIYRTQCEYKKINPDTCQSQITLPILIWDTL